MAPKFKLLTEVEPATATRSAVYSSTQFASTTQPPESELTLFHTFSTAVEKFPERDCLGARPIGADGEAGPYEFWNYRETGERVHKVASGLHALGLKQGSKIGVFSINCREWMLAMQACNRMSYICVPIYDTLAENAVEYIVNHSETSAVFVSAVNLPKLQKAIPKIKGSLKNVIYWGNPSEEDLAAIKATKLTVHSFSELMEMGEAKLTDPVPPSPEDLCTIMYTSGTTGDPKGVSLKHKAVASAVASLIEYVDSVEKGNGEERYLSYLPLAHIFDRMGEEMELAVGAAIGYFQGDITKLISDIQALKPTIFVGVPRVFDRMYGRIMQGVETASFIKRFLFKWGFNRKSQAIRDGIPQAKASPFSDRLVFGKTKALLGGSVRLIITGGAPIAPHTEEFLKVCFCSDVVQGYGLTETCAGSFITIPDDPSMTSNVGPPLPFVQFCLESVPDMNYDATGDVPMGEVCIKTPFSFSGYYKAKDITDEVLEADGWFHTGDVGKITPDGCLQLIDRKKNILKLSQGEYVSVEKIEGAYKESTAVEQIWAYGDSFQNYMVAVVVPSEEFVKKWAADNQKGYDYVTLCKDEALLKDMQAILNDKAKEQKLKGFEVVKKIALESEQFSVENELMTPTFKLKRPQLKTKYQAIITSLYSA